ncbi:hypothetical protein Efla_000844 [Eimeria flavescens]
MAFDEESGCQSTAGSAGSPSSSSKGSCLSEGATEEYRRAFSSSSSSFSSSFCPSSSPFMAYWRLEEAKDGQVESQIKWTSRKAFLVASLRSVARIRSFLGCKSLQGVRIAHYMSCNRIEDAVLRLAAAFSGYSVVTINWGADSFDRVKYKILSTKCAAVFFDDSVDKGRISKLKEEVASHGTHVLSAHSVAVEADLHAETEAADLDAEFTATCCSSSDPSTPPPTAASERMVVFTSGTTSDPKGVRLSYGNLETACRCILDAVAAGPQISVHFVAVNPFHHVNTSVIFETAIRHQNARIHLIDRYRTSYWKVLLLAAEAAAAEQQKNKNGGEEEEESFRVVAPLVSRHIDFLQSLSSSGRLGEDGFSARLRKAVADKNVVLLLGSAPVGPSTINSLNSLLGKMPKIRFGSTETALQVTAVPFTLSDEAQLKALQKGWLHAFAKAEKSGFYIGRPHKGLTEMRVVKSVDPKDEKAFMADCEEGEPGLLVSRGGNTMLGYANSSSQPFASGGWYLGFGDIGFYLLNEQDGEKDFYWVSRAADVLIKGGANYSCRQIEVELQAFFSQVLNIQKETVSVAAMGLKWRSEHEDDLCVTVELPSASSSCLKEGIEEELLAKAGAATTLPKGFKPDFLRIAEIPKTFKGAVDAGALRDAFLRRLESTAAECRQQETADATAL